jgi:hypothetical protein
MPGGLLQLVAKGGQDLLFNGNPTTSFFKKTYRTYTNFATESIRVGFDQNTMHMQNETVLTAKIKRNADLIQQVYLFLKIPSINKIKDEVFRYVHYLGECVISEYSVFVGGSRIDTQYGEWMHVWNQLSMTSDKRYGYDEMIGNVSGIYSPDDYHHKSNGEVQVHSRLLCIPLTFWFNKHPGLALPLIALQYHEVELVIKLRPMLECFTVNDTRASLTNAREYFGTNEAIPIDPYLEINYIFLDTNERTYFAKQSHDYLIEQIDFKKESDVKINTTVDLTSTRMVKEVVWMYPEDGRFSTNRWFKYVSESTPECDSYHDDHVMKSASILFNGLSRIEDKPAEFFGLLQPYQHHSVIPSKGVYLYSFSMHPENFQPSGACNFARINRVHLRTECRAEALQTNSYDIHVYTVGYNFLRIISGLASVAYS